MPGTIEFDGNWVDMATIGVAFLYSVGVILYSKKGFSFERLISEAAYGFTIFPILLLTGSVFFSGLMTILMSGSRPTIFLAGLYTLLIIIKRPFDKAEVSADEAGPVPRHRPTDL
jgi:hypothetical protein